MIRKVLVVMTTVAILFVSIVTRPILTKADSKYSPDPDIITDKIIFVSSEPLISELKNGTLGIVTFNSGRYLGVNIPGGNIDTDIIITLDKSVSVLPTTPVALIFRNGKVEVYLATQCKIVALPWNYLSSSFEIKQSWFPQYISAQIVKLEKTGAWEKEIDYSYNPPLQKISYFYKIYLTTKTNPYLSPTNYNLELGIMIPDYLVDEILKLAENHDFIWIGINGDTNIYFWIN